MAPYRSLDFIASLGITINDESWWYGSDPIMFENSSGTFFLQAWISDSNNLFCIKRTDYSTQQVEVVSELPSTTDSSTLYFVTS